MEATFCGDVADDMAGPKTGVALSLGLFFFASLLSWDATALEAVGLALPWGHATQARLFIRKKTLRSPPPHPCTTNNLTADNRDAVTPSSAQSLLERMLTLVSTDDD